MRIWPPKFPEVIEPQTNEEPPSEAWLFTQAILGNAIPKIVRPVRSNHLLSEQVSRDVSLSEGALDAQTRQSREALEWAAQISGDCEAKLHAIVQRERELDATWARAEQFAETLTARSFDPSKHPRGGNPENRGQFSTGWGGGGLTQKQSYSVAQVSEPLSSSDPPRAEPIKTKTQLPAAHRGTWITGTPGHGTFRYNDAPENVGKELVGKEVRFENGNIAIGGLPAEAYYLGSSHDATVEIPEMNATQTDKLLADIEMRKRLGNPNWQRPSGYIWNHAGPPGSKKLELVHQATHEAISHKGPAAELRAQRRAAAAGNVTGRAMAGLTVYLSARDALQAGGILKPSYEIDEWEEYHFAVPDGSIFRIERPWFKSPRRTYIEGPKKGQSESITQKEVDEYRKMGEAEFGKYIPGSLIKDPRFIPGRQRKRLPLIQYRRGLEYDAGWIDEKGVHRHSNPRVLPI